MRKLLCEAAWSCVRFNPTLRDFFRRVSGDDPGRRKIAIVATAHRLCRVMAAMLRTGEAWRGQQPQQPERSQQPQRSQQRQGGLRPAAGAPLRKTPKP